MRAAPAGVLLLRGGYCVLAALMVACGPDPELRPDERLQEELGISPRDEVHRITLTGGAEESVAPAEVVIPPDAWVEFVTADSWVHEVRFELDSLSPGALEFLTTTDQLASPPMVDPDSRFLVSLHDAPTGRYPFLVEGNGAPGRGAVVVREEGS